MSFLRSLFGAGRRQQGALSVGRLAEHGVTVAECEALGRWIERAAPRELYHANPRYLAEEVGLSPRRMLHLLAPAVVTGLFNLNWEVACLGCGHQQPAFESLRTARATHTCQMCREHFQAAIDQSVIVTFSVSERLRGGGTDDPTWRKQVSERYGSLTGHELLTIQPFRDLFVNEPLPTTEAFEVRRMALLFTDLGSSTALYARWGDPRAYSLVREHFLLLLQAVTEHDGAVVKTVGDAVMAVFARGNDALAAAIASQEAIARFNRAQALPEQDALSLKVGIHVGPCLMVTLNERLDYFGTTVNAAARVQSVAGPGEITLTEELWRELEEPAPFAHLRFESSEMALRGLEHRPYLIHRFRVSEAASLA